MQTMKEAGRPPPSVYADAKPSTCPLCSRWRTTQHTESVCYTRTFWPARNVERKSTDERGEASDCWICAFNLTYMVNHMYRVVFAFLSCWLARPLTCFQGHGDVNADRLDGLSPTLFVPAKGSRFVVPLCGSIQWFLVRRIAEDVRYYEASVREYAEGVHLVNHLCINWFSSRYWQPFAMSRAMLRRSTMVRLEGCS